MITIMKKYENPMFQVVSIKKNDIITGSDPKLINEGYDSNQGPILGADRFRDDWDAGY